MECDIAVADSVACALSAVDVQDLAGHERCVLEVESTVHDVCDSAYVVLRMHPGVGIVRIDAGMHWGVDHAGGDRVDPNTLARIFNGQRARCDVPCWRPSAKAVMLDSWQRFT
jgi:hypothetical protein